MNQDKHAFRFHFSRLASMGLIAVMGLGAVSLNGCSSAPPIQAEAYAKLSDHRTFEYPFAVVWKAIEESLRNYKVTDRDPSNVSAQEMKKLTRRTLTTDWIYGQSRDKYQQYTINGTPRRQALQTRFRYFVDASSVMGGTTVKIETTEEIERLNTDGTSAGYDRSDQPDSGRAAEFLDKINTAILSAAP